MNSDELIDLILSETDHSKRQQIILNHKENLGPQLFEDLKARADKKDLSDARESIRIADICQEVCSVLRIPICRAFCMWIRANGLTTLGQASDALPLYEESALIFREHGNELREAQTFLGRVHALASMGRYEESLQIAMTARDRLKTLGHVQEAAKLSVNAGSICFVLDRYNDAFRHYEEAWPVYQDIGDPVRLARLEANQANVLANLDRFREAIERYDRARKLFESLGMWLDVARTDNNLGWLHRRQGHYRQSLETFERARLAFEELENEEEVCRTTLNIADIYRELNLFQSAAETYDAALARYQKKGIEHEVSRAMVHRALVAWRLRDTEIAANMLQEALRRFTHEGNRVWMAKSCLNLCGPLTDLDRLDEALSHGLEGGSIFQELGLRSRAAESNLVVGSILAQLGDDEAAQYHLGLALETFRKLGLSGLTSRCHHEFGKIARRSGDLEEAYRRFEEAVRLVEETRGALPGEEFRSSYLVDKLAVFDDMVLTCIEAQNEMSIREAFEYVERAKSRVLTDLLLRHIEVVALPKDEVEAELLKNLQSLREELSWHYSRMSELEGKGVETSLHASEAVWKQIQAKEIEVTTIHRRLAMRGAECVSPQETGSFGLEGLQSRLNHDSVLLEYYIAQNKVMAFLVGPESIDVKTDLCSLTEVRSNLLKLRFQLRKFAYGQDYALNHQRYMIEAVQDHLIDLYYQLIAPVREHLVGKDLIIVPHGELHQLPFHALYDGTTYLIDGCAISYAPSVSVLQLCYNKQPVSGAHPLIFGIPDSDVPAVNLEVDSIAKIFDAAHVVIGEEATRETLRSQCADCSLLHIASHSVFRPLSPLFSAVRMADGWLSLDDIYRLDLRCSLVTLSGCETGLSAVLPGDELIGLMRGFFYAGTPSVVVSLWRVGDQTTAELMGKFYKYLREGWSKVAALRRAALEVKEQYPHPYYWAPFVLQGANGAI